ncbi:MAG: hypothetical protein ACI8SE_001880 [Bacteroidia bacterium]|jgi:hypothetical protein
MKNLNIKNLIAFLIVTSAIVGCKNESTTNQTQAEGVVQTIEGRYGDSSWTIDEAFDPASFNFLLGDRDSLDAVLTGKISSVCQTKGCWMKMDVEGMEMRVRFRDYKYFVPMNSTGHQATVKGTFYVDSISVDQLKEYARDAKEPQEEIDAITDYEISYSFMADGVFIE